MYKIIYQKKKIKEKRKGEKKICIIAHNQKKRGVGIPPQERKKDGAREK